MAELLSCRPDAGTWAIPFTNAGCAYLGLSLAEFVRIVGDPQDSFPSGAERVSGVFMWNWGNALFSAEGKCLAIRMDGESRASVLGIEVFSRSLIRFSTRPQIQNSRLIRRNGSCTSLRHGFRVTGLGGLGQLRRPREMLLVAPGSVEIEVERIWQLATELLPHPWEQPAQFVQDVRRALGYGRLSRTDLRVIDRQMSLGRWAFALTYLLYAVEERDLRLASQQEGVLRELATRLGVQELPDRFALWGTEGCGDTWNTSGRCDSLARA